MKKETIKLLLWLFLIVWMGVIFLFSAQPDTVSKKSSSEVTKKIVNLIPSVKKMPEAKKMNIVAKVETYVRKCAHMFLYFVLAILAASLICVYGFPLRRIFLYALLTCVLYAMSDEMHQFFVTGRSGQVTDVLIDTAGAVLGWIVWYIFFRKVKKSIKNK